MNRGQQKPDVWIPFDSGSYNRVYVNPSKTEVLKIQAFDSSSDSPERSIRIWNEINSRQTKAKIYQNNNGGFGWTCPFIKGEQANDSEIRGALLDIFNSSGRIVIDAPISGNFIKTDSGEVICVDVGQALQLEKREAEGSDKKHRRRSIVSLMIFNAFSKKLAADFEEYKYRWPQTIDTLKALLFIKHNRPNISNVDFLRENLKLTNRLAKSHDIQNRYGNEINKHSTIVNGKRLSISLLVA